MPHRPPKPKKFAVADLETDPFKRGRTIIEPFASGFFDGKTLSLWWKTATCDPVAELVARCKKWKGIVYLHNGGNFDIHFLLPYLPVAECKFLCIGKRIVSLKTPWGCEFRDSFAIIPKALAAYKKTKINYAWFEKAVREKYRRKILDYLADDLRDLYSMVAGFLSRFPGEITLASATFKILQKEFGADIERSDSAYDATFRPFYFAGRVQFWHLGRVVGKCYVVDINSAFPWAMTKEHAHGTDFKVSTRLPKKRAEQSFITVRCWSDGELPVRTKKGVEFPIGSGVFNVTGWEWLAAVELGKVRDVEIIQVLTPKRTKNFSRFVTTYYGAKLAAKKRGDKEEEFFNKIVLNAGYGKMALNPRRFSEVAVTGIYDTPADITGRTKKARKKNAELAGWKVKWDDPVRGLTFHSRSSYREGIDKFINVATAASITGCVRAFLMRSKAKCRDVLYCDTDSLVARSVRRLKKSDKLGDWKLEMIFPGTRPYRSIKSPGNSLYIAGKKLYAGHGRDGKKWKWKTASKGVRLSPGKIVAVANGFTRTHTALAPTYSVFSTPKVISRTIRRADKRKK